MAEFLTTNGIASQIENIIIEAKSKLILVSPYLKISKTFHQRLNDASRRGVKITIIYGKDELNAKQRELLTQLKNLELFYLENLHAKCYFNESKMVVTSMNMYEFSEKNNREMGILLDRILDKDLYNKAVVETKSFADASIRESITPLAKASNVKKRFVQAKGGYCIRCGQIIELDLDRPLCSDCYSVWSQWGDEDYVENVCHSCGSDHDHVSKARPECYDCYTS